MDEDVKNMSEEEKKQYLEELRKQLDPEILSRMADYMGAGPVVGANSIPSDNSTSTASPRSIRSFSTPSDIMKDRRATKFQERVAQRKREMELAEIKSKSEEPKIIRKVAILSSTEIWTRIVENQFKTLDFNEIHTFYDFHSLIKFLVECYSKGCLDELAIAIAVKEMVGFLFSWKKLRNGDAEENKLKFLENVPYFFIIESQKQIQEHRMEALDPDQIISLTDDTEVNKEKIARVMMQFDGYRKRGES